MSEWCQGPRELEAGHAQRIPRSCWEWHAAQVPGEASWFTAEVRVCQPVFLPKNLQEKSAPSLHPPV